MKEILIYGAIGWDVDPRDIARQFQDAAGEDVLLRIHSEGGSVHDGNAIISAIRGHDATVHGQVDGMAFSMAANIALEVRDNLTMPADAWIMFHEVRSSAGGQVEDLEQQAAMMRTMNDAITARLSSLMDLTQEETAELLNKEIWMTGAEAHAAGIVANLSPAQALAAHLKRAAWPNAPKEIFTNQTKPNQTDTMKGIFKIFQSDDSSEPEVTMLKPQDVASEELTALQKNFDELRATHAAELVARDEKHKQYLTAKLDELRAEITAKAETEKDELTAKHGEEIEAKNEAIKAAEEASDKKANATLAQAGHPPVEVSSADDKTIAEQYQAMKAGPERSKFREDHKAELQEAFGPGVLR